jgi:hypothetical protein
MNKFNELYEQKLDALDERASINMRTLQSAIGKLEKGNDSKNSTVCFNFDEIEALLSKVKKPQATSKRYGKEHQN